MIWPPSVLRIRVVKGERKPLRLWIPLFVIWPLVLLLAVVLMPLVLLGAVLIRGGGFARKLLLAVPRSYVVPCSSRGLQVQVVEKNEQVYVSVH